MDLRIVIDPIACDGRGACADMLPERIRLDDWGYPIVDPAPIKRDLERLARKTATVCPKLAITVEQISK